MPDFLLELRSEEIPARMQAGARAELEKLFRREMDAAGVTTGEVTVWSTPRRLALIARDLPGETEAVREERKGPKADAPDKAIEGFLRSTGLSRNDLETREVKGAPTLFAVGAACAKKLLARAPLDALPAEVTDKRKTGFSVPVDRWLEQSADLDVWRSVPSLARAGCPWARRWAYTVHRLSEAS